MKEAIQQRNTALDGLEALRIQKNTDRDDENEEEIMKLKEMYKELAGKLKEP